MDTEKVPGFFLSEDVNFVKQSKGDAEVAELQKLLPKFPLKNINPVKKYPLKEEVALLRAAAIVVYGNDSVESWQKLGVHDFDTVKESSLGKVLLSLFGNNFIDLIKNGARLFFFFAPFVKFSYTDLSEEGAVFTIENNPYPKEYYLGLLTSMLRHVKNSGTITVEEIGPKKVRYYLKA